MRGSCLWWNNTVTRPLAAQQYGQAALQWMGARCCQKHTWCVSPPGRQIKLMPCSPPPVHQLLLVHVAIEKLTSSKQNKWQHTTKDREWTGPNGAVFEEDLSVGLYHQRRARQKKGPWFESLLGNWGSYVWNVSLYACVISHPASPPATGHTICLCSQCLNYVFPFSWKRKRKMWRPWKRTTSSHFECACQIAI